MASSHRAAVGILDMSRHFWQWEQKCRDLICFINIDTSCIYRGLFLAPYDTFRHLWQPLCTVPCHFRNRTLQNPRGPKYSHGCSVWTRHKAVGCLVDGLNNNQQTWRYIYVHDVGMSIKDLGYNHWTFQLFLSWKMYLHIHLHVL